jgi:hypothetical protein
MDLTGLWGATITTFAVHQLQAKINKLHAATHGTKLQGKFGKLCSWAHSMSEAQKQLILDGLAHRLDYAVALGCNPAAYSVDTAGPGISMAITPLEYAVCLPLCAGSTSIASGFVTHSFGSAVELYRTFGAKLQLHYEYSQIDPQDREKTTMMVWTTQPYLAEKRSLR